jgi:Tfp pilus assembly protein PilV
MSRIGSDRQQGWLLVEAMVALTVLTVGVLGFLFSFQANFRATREMGNRDLAQAALENAVETLHSASFGTLYTTYQGARLPASGLLDPTGNPAQVVVQFDVNETLLAAEYGPVTDIDGDGANTTTNASTSYVLLPARLTLDYQMSYGPESKTVYLIFAP